VLLQQRAILGEHRGGPRDRFVAEPTAHVDALPEPGDLHVALELATVVTGDQQANGVGADVDAGARHTPWLPIPRFMPISVSSSMRAAASIRNKPCSLLVVVHEPGFFTPR